MSLAALAIALAQLLATAAAATPPVATPPTIVPPDVADIAASDVAHLRADIALVLETPGTFTHCRSGREVSIYVGSDSVWIRSLGSLVQIDHVAGPDWESVIKVLAEVRRELSDEPLVDLSIGGAARAADLFEGLRKLAQAGHDVGATLPGWGRQPIPGLDLDAFSIREFGYGGVAMLVAHDGVYVVGNTALAADSIHFVEEGRDLRARLTAAIESYREPVIEGGLSFSVFAIHEGSSSDELVRSLHEHRDIAEEAAHSLGLLWWSDAPILPLLDGRAIRDGRLKPRE